VGTTGERRLTPEPFAVALTEIVRELAVFAVTTAVLGIPVPDMGWPRDICVVLDTLLMVALPEVTSPVGVAQLVETIGAVMGTVYCPTGAG